MSIVNRRRVMGGGGGAPLPYDAEIEYLESTGTQWINTENRLDFRIHNYEFSYVASFSRVTGRQLMGDDQACYMGVNNARFELRYNSYYGTVAVDSRHTWGKTFVSKIEYEFIDGVEVGSANRSSLMPSFKYIYLFNVTTTQTPCYAKLYSAQFSEDGVMLYDMIPVRVGTVGYMYDKVSKRLFGNVGSGDFVLGPDKN